MSAFNPNAKKPEDHAANCQFQLTNVEGWLKMATDKKDLTMRLIAAAKAQCLLESAQLLVAAFEAEVRPARADARPTSGGAR
jgi:hypothetical protein